MKRLPSTVALLVVTSTALAQGDIRDVNRRMPLSIHDAYPLPKGKTQLQYDLQFDRQSGKDSLRSRPQIQYGFARGWFAQVGVPILYRGDRKESGDIQLELFRGAPDIDSPRTAFAMRVQATVPSGVGTRGIDTAIEGIVTQPLVFGAHDTRAHLNLTWEHNAERLAGERTHGYVAVAGVTTRLNEQTLALFDVVRDQDPRQKNTTNLAEFGFNRSLGGGLEAALGVGFRLDKNSPHSRLRFGLQYSF